MVFVQVANRSRDWSGGVYCSVNSPLLDVCRTFVHPIALFWAIPPLDRRPFLQYRMARGHLSRPACRHVKQGAKKAGVRAHPTRAPERPIMTKTSSTRPFRPATKAVHAGTLRSQFGETSEALFLTQGY
eukprot:gene20964-21714_t